MIKVLFIGAVNPVSVHENLMQPLWPAYLAAYAEKYLGKEGLESKFITRDVQQEIESFKPDIVAISSVTQNFHYVREYAGIAKRFGRPVIVGGMHVTMIPQCLTRDMDVGCIGEGEQTFYELLKLYNSTGGLRSDGLAGIPGIVYHDGEKLARTAARSPIKSLDDLPHPKRSITGYHYRSYVYTARGCAYNCVFCSCSSHWGTVRYSSPEYVISEIDELIQNGVKVIRFNDDNFIANKQRFLQIADLVIANDFHKKVKFSCWCRANNVTPEVVKALKAMNIVSVKMGLESGCDRTLQYLKGSVTVKDNWAAVNQLKDTGIQVNGDFIIGAPEETYDEMMETYHFIKKSRVDMVDISVLTPLPGTQVWEYALRKKLVTNDMDWASLDFRFSANSNGAPILSETMSREQLLGIFKKFQRLRFIKTVKAMPNSPWLNEIPRLLKKWLMNRMVKVAAIPLWYFVTVLIKDIDWT
jgi:anaerobic magnesium-protoporphyrin IX monomethyl ester cyclase